MITWSPFRTINTPITQPITENYLGKSGYFPLSLFAKGEQGVWYDPSDLSTLFQDAAGTVPVTAMDQPVGLMRDKSGRGNHASQTTSAARPFLRNTGSLWYLEFDGVDDFLVTSAINFSATDKMSVFAGVMKLSDVALGMIVELSADVNSNAGTFYLTGPGGNGAASINFVSKGTQQAASGSSSLAAPITVVMSAVGDIAGSVSLTRANGVQGATRGTSQGTGSYGNYPLYIGRRGGASLPFKGYLYGLVVRGAATDTTGTTSTEKYMSVKSGVVLP